jgi:hypothetical protein
MHLYLLLKKSYSQCISSTPSRSSEQKDVGGSFSTYSFYLYLHSYPVLKYLETYALCMMGIAILSVLMNLYKKSEAMAYYYSLFYYLCAHKHVQILQEFQ